MSISISSSSKPKRFINPSPLVLSCLMSMPFLPSGKLNIVSYGCIVNMREDCNTWIVIPVDAEVVNDH